MGQTKTDRRQFDDDELHWYALDVVRQKEYVAGFILQRMGCMTFIPTRMAFQKKTRYAKSKIEVARPDLPGVVFCGFPAEPNWYKVMGMHLVNGVLSVDGKARRIDTASKEWLEYRGRQLDGTLVIEKQWMLHRGEEIERSVALVQVQGRGVIRSPLSLKAKAANNRPVVITASGERARILGAMLSPQPVRMAA
jgi:hypothetical protein